MKYFRNTELAKLYHVSEKSVRNWIEAAEGGKLDLELYEEKGKFYIANVSKNTQAIAKLVERGKKYKNTRGFKTVTPQDKFYQLYSPKQIFDIISNIDIYREVPIQYSYFNSGARRWDSYTQHLLDSDVPNSLINTIQLIDLNFDYIDTLLEGYAKVNIIDIGPGNALPVRDILEHFIKNGKLRRYIGIDISNDMLEIARANIQAWFGKKVPFEGYIRDIVYERFDDLLTAESFSSDGGPTANLVLFLGGTLSNLREPNHPLATIHDSLGKNDLLVFSKKLDTLSSRRYFEIAAPGNLAIDLVLNLLNVHPSYYTIEQFFDEQKMARQVQAKLNVALSIEFQLEGQRRILELNKDESILLWRARHQGVVGTLEQFDANGFELLQAVRSKDQEYLLVAAKIKTGLV